MSDEISEEAWERAALERVGFILHGDANADIRYYSGDSGKVTRAAALAAQAELDAADEVTDAEIFAAADAHAAFFQKNGANDFCGQVKAMIKAARKARQA